MKTLDFTDLTNAQMARTVKKFINRLSAWISFQQTVEDFAPFMGITVDRHWIQERDYWVSRLPEWEERAKNDPSAVSF